MRIKNKLFGIVIKIFSFIYSNIYLRFLLHLKPSKIEQKFGDIVNTMKDCDKCSNPHNVPPDDSLDEHICDEHMHQIREGELGDIL